MDPSLDDHLDRRKTIVLYTDQGPFIERDLPRFEEAGSQAPLVRGFGLEKQDLHD